MSRFCDERYGRENVDYIRRSNQYDRRDLRYDNFDQRPRRVPGLVMDPNKEGSLVEYAILRGQKSTLGSQTGDSIDSSYFNRGATKDNFSYVTRCDSGIPTLSHDFPSSSRKDINNMEKRHYQLNHEFLSLLPAVAGLALLVTSIILTSWTSEVVVSLQDNNVTILYRGLFKECWKVKNIGSNKPIKCGPIGISSNKYINNLEQAARGLIVISTIISFAAIITCVYLSFTKRYTPRGSLINAAIFALAGMCAVSALGCYSAVVYKLIESTKYLNVSSASTSFYLGWMGTAFILIASLTSLLGHCVKQKYAN